MTTINGLALPQVRNGNPNRTSVYRKLGPAVGVLGFGLVMATAVANWVSIGDVGSDPAAVAESSMWAGGLGILGLAIIKSAVVVVLVGIIFRLWQRVDSVKATLPLLRVRKGAPAVRSTDRGVVASTDIPKSLPIHRVASRMWLPASAMGAMGVVAGAVLRIVASSEGAGTESFRRFAAWGVGIEFFGEALLLSGISFLLATILASLRQGGSEVQHGVGAPVKVLKMPATAKAFIGLMMVGLMIGIGQFVASIVLAGYADDPARYGEIASFVGPLREFALGTILAGIVLALATIGSVLGFQFDRIRELARLN